MPTRTLFPLQRSGVLPWLLWGQMKAPTSALTDVASGHYPMGVVPSMAWTPQGSGSPNLGQAVAEAGDSKYAQISATGAQTSQHLVATFAGNTAVTGQSLKYLRFKVLRRAQTGMGQQVADLHVYLTLDGAPLTGVDKKIVANWVQHATDYETVYYTFTDANLTTLGVTASDVAAGRIGLAIQASTTGTIAGYIDSVAMASAYSVMQEIDLDYTELLGDVDMPTPWQRIFDWYPTVPATDDILGIEVDLTAWTDDAAAQPLAPMLTELWDGGGPGSSGPAVASASSASVWTPDSGTIVSAVATSDNVRVSKAASSSTSKLWLTGFDLAVPSIATITGVVVHVEASRNFAGPGDPAGITTLDLWLTKNGAATVGTVKNFGVPNVGSEVGVDKGGPSDMWGTTLTPAEVNASGFGVALAQGPESNGEGPTGENTTINRQIDHVTVTVHYTMPLLYPLEVALSLNGIDPVGDTWLIFTTDSVDLHTCGGPADLWGRSWLPAEFAEPFSVLVRRPEVSGSVSSQYVTSARVRVTTTSNQGTLTMPVRQTLTERVVLGVEDTPGTISTKFRRLRALNYQVRPNVNMKKHRPQGEKMTAISVPTREWSTGSISGILDYYETPLALEAIIGSGVHSGTGNPDERNIHVYNLDNRVRSAFRTYSLERGEKATRAQRVLYLVHNGLQLQINTQDCQVSGGFFGMAMADMAGSSMTAGSAEVQTMTITGTPTGGTYKLAFRGAETTALLYNANAAAITAALEALPSIGAGNVVVTGTGPYTITFAVSLADSNVPMVVLANNSLTGGTSPTATIVQTTKGGLPEYPLVPVLPGHWNIYLADTQAGLAAGKLDKTVGVAATGIDVADRWNPFWTLDRDTGTTFTDTTEMDPKFKANLTVGANSVGMGLLTPLRSGATKWLKMEAVGPVIGVTSDYHKMIWEGPVKLDDTADYGDEDGRVIYPWPLEWCEGPNGEVPTLTVENGYVYA